MKRLPIPFWQNSSFPSSFRSLQTDLEAEVVIVGGGITGLTAAAKLSRSGFRVAVVEKGRIGGQDSSRTTAHLTAVLDTRFYKLVQRFGLERARQVVESGLFAIDHIENNCRTLGINCRFERRPGYLFSEDPQSLDELKHEADAASQCGLSALYSKTAPLPFPVAGAVWFPGQAQFHPLEYLTGLAHAVANWGVAIYEETDIVDIKPGSTVTLRTPTHSIKAEQVILATHYPVLTPPSVLAKLAAYRTYALGFVTRANHDLGGLFWDTEDPYHYLRSHPLDDGTNLLIVGGEDHKTGTEEQTEERFQALLQYCRYRFSVTQESYRWSGQVIEPLDGLPYIGNLPGEPNQWIATGYAGNGMTLGTLAGNLIAEEIIGTVSPWAELYRPDRMSLSNLGTLISENKDFPLYYLKDRMTSSSRSTLHGLARGEGKVMEINGQRVAAYLNPEGKLNLRSAVCSHMGCIVHFNQAEKSWDCPCHGSRFAPNGDVINGPALTGLEAVCLEEPEPEVRTGTK